MTEAARSKVFGGRRYYLAGEAVKKGEAKAMAKDWRRRGRKVRVVPVSRGHLLYSR